MLIEQRIDAPPAAVFAVVSDAHRILDWYTSFRDVVEISGALDRVGVTYRAIWKVGWGRISARWTVTKVEYPSLWEATGTTPFGGYSWVRHEFHPVEGSTFHRFSAEYKLGWGPVGAFIDWAFLERWDKPITSNEVTRLKELIERQEPRKRERAT